MDEDCGLGWIVETILREKDRGKAIAFHAEMFRCEHQGVYCEKLGDELQVFLRQILDALTDRAGSDTARMYSQGDKIFYIPGHLSGMDNAALEKSCTEFHLVLADV